jgi:hypothetical protein
LNKLNTSQGQAIKMFALELITFVNASTEATDTDKRATFLALAQRIFCYKGVLNGTK